MLAMCWQVVTGNGHLMQHFRRGQAHSSRAAQPHPALDHHSLSALSGDLGFLYKDFLGEHKQCLQSSINKVASPYSALPATALEHYSLVR